MAECGLIRDEKRIHVTRKIPARYFRFNRDIQKPKEIGSGSGDQQRARSARRLHRDLRRDVERKSGKLFSLMRLQRFELSPGYRRVGMEEAVRRVGIAVPAGSQHYDVARIKSAGHHLPRGRQYERHRNTERAE